MGKVYRGERTPEGCRVTVDGAPLDARHDLLLLSADFEWGYDGTGPHQLALALLADHFGEGEAALARYRRFTSAVIEGLAHDSWTLTSEDIERSFSSYTEVPMDLKTLLARVRGEI